MAEKKPLPYKKALPLLLADSRMSYRELQKKTGKSASYWSQTLTGRVSVPQNPRVYEQLAEVFGVTPFYFREYGPRRAAQLVLEDSSAAYDVISNITSAVPIRYLSGINVSSKPERSTAPSLPGAEFAVVVKGDSLERARLRHGDLVYLGGTMPTPGDLVLCSLVDRLLLGLFFPTATGFELRFWAEGPVVGVGGANDIQGVEIAVLRR